MDRRNFLHLGGIATLSGAAGMALGNTSAAASLASDEVLGLVSHTGSDMAGWETALGDGIWAAPGQPAVALSDLATTHDGTHSELQANIGNRAVMAHNITYRREESPVMLTQVHACSWEFQMPYLPTTGGWPHNAQTLEGGFFVWDGASARVDYGIAFQWVLNPWMSSFGQIRTWTDTNGGQWTSAGYLAPDNNWHVAEFVVDTPNQSCALIIDGNQLPTAFTLTPKPAHWGNEIAARLGIEIISLWPGSNPTPPSHRAKFRNWSWLQIPSASCA